MATTWVDDIKAWAEELAGAYTESLFKAKLAEIEAELKKRKQAGWTPGDFWERLRRDFDQAPKTRQMRKDATASHAMHDYEAFVDRMLAARILAEQASK